MKRIRKFLIIALMGAVSVFACMSAACTLSVSEENYTHNYGVKEERIIKSATCTEKGISVWKCIDCNEEVVKVVPELGHTLVSMKGLKPTCTENGYTEYSHCKTCNADVSKEVIPATGHTLVIDEAVPNTCTTDGKTEGSHCSVCGEITKEQEIVPFAHTLVADNMVNPTCTETGLTEGSHCSVCNEITVTQVEIPATGHSLVIDNAVSPTCLGTGKTQGEHCSSCSLITIEQQTVSALGHTVSVRESIAPTCTTTGKTAEVYCSCCDEVIVASESVAATGHAVVSDSAISATCQAEGLTAGEHCSVCSKVTVSQQPVAKIKHDFTSGDICGDCGAAQRTTTLTCRVDGVSVGEVQYDVNTDEIILPEIPEKEGYTAKWESYDKDYNNATLNAVYEPITYKIIYHVNYVSTKDGVKTAKVDYYGAWEEFWRGKDSYLDGVTAVTEYTIESGDIRITTDFRREIRVAEKVSVVIEDFYTDELCTQKFSGVIPKGSTGDIHLYTDVTTMYIGPY